MSVWTERDEKDLIELSGRKTSLSVIAKKLGRTKNAVQSKARRLGLTLNIKGRRWTAQEESDFVKHWCDGALTNDALIRKHNRTWNALQTKANLLKLGPRPFDACYLSVQDICFEMNVSKERVYRWIKHGLSTKSSNDNRRKYLIDCEDLLLFLEKHQSWFDASVVSNYLFINKPKWLIDKQRCDKRKDCCRHQCEWTNEEDKRLQIMYQRGHSIKDMSKVFHRKESAIKTHLSVIGCKIQRPLAYTDDELKLLYAYSDIYTLSELCDMLPGRSIKGIEYKCKMLKISYHYSKQQCKCEFVG